MKIFKKILLSVAAIVIVLISVILIRTLTFTSKQIPIKAAEQVKLDETAAVQHMSQALQIQTIAYDDPKQNIYGNLVVMRDWIDSTYPAIHANLKRTIINNYSLLYEWTGTNASLKPIIMTAHLDVVPEGNEKWEQEPFSGSVKDGYIWGRGALDDKGALISNLEAVEYLLESGYKPERTIYLAFGHDEEAGTTGGMQGAREIAEYLKNQGVHAESIIDEGGEVAAESMSVVPGKCMALIGVAEKGFLTLKITATAESGHAMMPPKDTAIGMLAKAITDLEKNKMPSSLNGTVGLTFDYLGPEMPFFEKMLFANRWLFGGLLQSQLAQTPMMAAMMHTTAAPTIIQGGSKESALPATASATVNFRILPGETSQDVINHVKSTFSDPRITVEQFGTVVHEPFPASGVDSEGYKVLYQSIREVFPDVIVAPTLMTGRTDSLYYKDIVDNILRFSPYEYDKGDDKRPHGLNERIKTDNYVDMIQFYIRYIQNSAGSAT